MKTLKLIGLGIGIWSLSLVWPMLNDYLTPAITTATIIGLGTIYMIYSTLTQYQSPDDQPNQPTVRSSRPIDSITRPTKPIQSV
jgi:hypothetical protein